VLALAPTPEQGRRLTRAAVRQALVQAGRRRSLQARAVAVYDALAAPQLAAPAPIVDAYRQVVDVLVVVLRCLNAQIKALEQQLASQFRTHPDAAILQSQRGLGMVLSARVLGEFGDDPQRYATAKGRRRSRAPRRHPSSGAAGLGQSADWHLARLPGHRAVYREQTAWPAAETVA
jgi:hypothetical protein